MVKKIIKQSSDLITTREQTRAGFINFALEKNKRSTPLVESAKSLKVMASKAKNPKALLKLKDIRPAMLTAAGLSDKAKAGVRPVYMSQREYVRNMNDYYAITGLDNDEMKNPADYPDDQVLIGIEITDRDLITKYGVEAKWKSRQTTFHDCTNSCHRPHSESTHISRRSVSCTT